jgi:hypothetical protein
METGESYFKEAIFELVELVDSRRALAKQTKSALNTNVTCGRRE